MDLTTTARVKALIEAGGKAQTSLDGMIGTLVTVVSAAVEQYLGIGCELKNRTETFDLADGQKVVVLGAPAASISSVKHDLAHVFGTGTDLASTAYTLDDGGRLLYLDDAILSPGRNVLRVAYSGGVAASETAFAAAWPDVAGAVDLQVAHLIQRRDTLGTTNVAVGGSSEGFDGGIDLLPLVKRVLDLRRTR